MIQDKTYEFCILHDSVDLNMSNIHLLYNLYWNLQVLHIPMYESIHASMENALMVHRFDAKDDPGVVYTTTIYAYSHALQTLQHSNFYL